MGCPFRASLQQRGMDAKKRNIRRILRLRSSSDIDVFLGQDACVYACACGTLGSVRARTLGRFYGA